MKVLLEVERLGHEHLGGAEPVDGLARLGIELPGDSVEFGMVQAQQIFNPGPERIVDPQPGSSAAWLPIRWPMLAQPERGSCSSGVCPRTSNATSNVCSGLRAGAMRDSSRRVDKRSASTKKCPDRSAKCHSGRARSARMIIHACQSLRSADQVPVPWIFPPLEQKMTRASLSAHG